MSASHWRNNIAALFGIWRRSLRAGSIDAAQYRFQVEQVARAAELELRRIDKEQQMKVAVVILAGLSLSAACSGSNPTGPTGTYAPTPLSDGSARVTTMSTRDLPVTSPGNSGPSGPVQDFKMNGLGGLPEGRVLPQFRRITDQDTVAFYWLETARRNDERPPDSLFATPRPQGHEPIRVDRLGPLEMDAQPLYGFKPGTYDARVKAFYRGGSSGGWAYTTFSVDGTWWEEPVPVAPVEPPVCEGIVTPNGCLVREDE